MPGRLSFIKVVVFSGFLELVVEVINKVSVELIDKYKSEIIN